MPTWLHSTLPVVVGLFFIVFLRAQGTYWAARSLPTALSRWGRRSPRWARLAQWVDGPTPKKGARILERWGIIAIPLAFLTVGLQTAILAGAGLTRMRWSRFTLAMVPGCIAWAILYGLGLWAVWTTAVRAAAGSAVSWAILFALIGTVLVVKKRDKIRGAAMQVARS